MKSLSLLIKRSKFTRMYPQEYTGLYKPKLSDQDRIESSKINKIPLQVKFHDNTHPDFLPNQLDPDYRNSLRESLERADMLARRQQLNIPEFYVGSILSVVLSDEYSPNKYHKFVGLCIHRANEGLWSKFTLRNIIEKSPVEIEYELYNPSIAEIRVLLLEKRLDDNLFYLRDAPFSESRIPFDFTPVPIAKDAPIPVNSKKIKLLPPPWSCKWYLKAYKGIDEDSMIPYIDRKELSKMDTKMKVYERYDLMKHYREQENLDEIENITNSILLKHSDILEK